MRDFDSWVEEIRKLCEPDSLYFCDGSDEEYDQIASLMVKKGALIELSSARRPRSFLCRSDPLDVARVEQNTYISCLNQEDAGPTNNWANPKEMHQKLKKLFKGCMQGRVMYVIAYCMGKVGSSFSKFGVEITDSPYVVLNMKWMTSMGKEVLNAMKGKDFVPGVHSVGKPLAKGEKDVIWPCNPENRHIVHFPEEPSIWSYGSGYGGNALLGKKCFALRIASVLARDEKWLAEHMLILAITSPAGEKKYIAAAFPSACGKTNLAMLNSTLPGWKIESVGDDIAWMRIGKDGRLYAINPEAGYFGVAPGTSMKTNPNAMKTIAKNTIFTNVALTKEKDVWWEGMTEKPPEGLISWKNQPWDPNSKEPAAHPNSRFTVSAKQNPAYDFHADQEEGVPISAILFGGRRPATIPLVVEAFDWEEGVLMGASISSETTAAEQGEVGKIRHDPFAMLPFCGYHMGNYFSHWLEMKNLTDPEKLPRIYFVNWFRKNQEGSFLWPGFGENIRVLKWIFERCSLKADAKRSAIGYLPVDLDLVGLDGIDLETLFHVDEKKWLEECDEIQNYLEIFGSKLPFALKEKLHQLRRRLRS